MKKSKGKNNGGITLIALVITIIVMLILVGVTISMAVNGGLFNYAKEAAQETGKAKLAEQELTNLKSIEEVEASGKTTYDYLIDKYREKNMIKFYIKPYGSLTEVEYQAEEGMTLEGWLKSDYCPTNDSVVDDLKEIVLYNNRNGKAFIKYSGTEQGPESDTVIHDGDKFDQLTPFGG